VAKDSEVGLMVGIGVGIGFGSGLVAIASDVGVLAGAIATSNELPRFDP